MNKFNHHGTFDCRVCGRHTRDTERENGEVQLCPHCHHLSEFENMINDGDALSTAQQNTALVVARDLEGKCNHKYTDLFPFLAEFN